jgi:fibronectin type 3 domain-containing protein
VTGYQVLRNGLMLATTGAVTSYTDALAAPLTSYTYSITAVDAANNVSGLTPPVTATTPADTTPPTVPVGLAGTVVSSTEIDLTWTASTDDIGVTGYQVFRSGKRIATTGPIPAYADTTIASGTTYSYTVKAVDAAGNLSAASAPLSIGTPDTTPPSQPTRLSATAQGASKVALTWRASTDNVGVAGYQVYRNGSLLVPPAPITGTSYTDTGLLPSTKYTYWVVAYDLVGNLSVQSTSAAATTTADTTAPSAPTGLSGTAASETTVNLSWTASTDDVGVTGYRVFRSGAQIAAIGAVTTYGDATASAGTSYGYTVKAVDAAGNLSAASNTANVTTLDLTPPSAPTGLSASVTSPTKVTLSWTAATDNVGVTGYKVSRDGALIATTGAVTSYLDSTAAASTAYTYTVSAVDAAGNLSSASNSAAVTTPPADLTPPSAPSNLTAVMINASHINLTWTGSTDNIAVASYQVLRNGTAIGTTSSTAYADLTTKNNGSYTYTVKAVDTSGNVSTASNSATPVTPLFYDGFEAGNFSKWTASTNMTAQQQSVYAESWAARASNNLAATFADKDIPAQTDLYARAHLFVSSRSTAADILGFRLRSGSAIVTLGMASTGELFYRNGTNATVVTSTTAVSTGSWHEVKLHVKVSGSASLVEVWLDGAPVSSLTRTDSLGTTGIDRFELGDRNTTNTYTVAYDEVVADTKP